ncbi:MAG: hypothetical protein ABL984_00270 [Pyrinomonadaceae bacterium]
MPFTQELTFTLNKLTPLLKPEWALILTRRFQANTTVYKGQGLGQTTTGVNEVQTFTVTGTPTGGTFKLSFKGIKTAALAYNAAAATVQAALEALISVGTGNVSCGGGALPGTPVTITFQGALAAGPQPVVVFETTDNAFTGGTSPTGAVAVTTKGVAAGALKAWDGTLLADPTTGPSVSTSTGGTMPVGTYLAQMAWVTPAGETLPSLPTSIIIPDATNDRMVFAAINAANTPDEATAIRYYLNGAMVLEVAVASGAIAATNLDALPTSGIVPKAPQTVNTAYKAADGSHILRGVALADFTTDAEGLVTFGQVSTGMEQGQSLAEAPYFAEGIFRMGDLYGISSTNGPQLSNFGRFLSGVYSDAEGIYRLGSL